MKTKEPLVLIVARGIKVKSYIRRCLEVGQDQAYGSLAFVALDGDCCNGSESTADELVRTNSWHKILQSASSPGEASHDIQPEMEALLRAEFVAVVGNPAWSQGADECQAANLAESGGNMAAIVDRCEELLRFMEDHGLDDREHLTVFLRKSIRATRWFYERVENRSRAAFFQRLASFFRFVKGCPSSIEWWRVELDEKLWLWTILAGRMDLHFPVAFQHESESEVLSKIAHEFLTSYDYRQEWQVALAGRMSTAFDTADTVPIVMATDQNYLMHLSVAISSIVAHSSFSRNYDFVVIVDFDVTPATISKFRQIENGHSNISIRFRDIRKDVFMPLISNFSRNLHLTLSTYYRLAAPYILPHDKCLWLDSDLIAFEDVSTLFDVDVCDCMIGGCRSLSANDPELYAPIWLDSIKHLEDMGWKNRGNYINAGVLIMNLSLMRERNVAIELFEACSRNSFTFCDQDCINLVLQDSIHYLEGKWNFVISGKIKKSYGGGMSSIPSQIRHPAGIWHYTGRENPWNHQFGHLSAMWWKYARLSPYYEELVASRPTQMLAHGVQAQSKVPVGRRMILAIKWPCKMIGEFFKSLRHESLSTTLRRVVSAICHPRPGAD